MSTRLVQEYAERKCFVTKLPRSQLLISAFVMARLEIAAFSPEHEDFTALIDRPIAECVLLWASFV